MDNHNQAGPTSQDLALPPVSIHLLFRNAQDVEWARSKEALEGALTQAHAAGGAYALNEAVEAQVPGWVAKRLESIACPSTGTPMHAGAFALPRDIQAYVEKRRVADANPPAWKRADGNRVYVMFAATGYCGWSPSGNNLASIARAAPPGVYLGEPVRVGLAPEQEARLLGYFDWLCDNW